MLPNKRSNVWLIFTGEVAQRQEQENVVWAQSNCLGGVLFGKGIKVKKSAPGEADFSCR